MAAKMNRMHMPDDDVLAAVGEVALRHEHMNHILIMTIKSVTSVTPQEAVAANSRLTSAELRRRVRRLARTRLGDGASFIQLEAVLAECERLTRSRNELIHCLWAEELDGDAFLRDGYGITRPVPTVEELKELATQIESHANQLNHDRLEGWLKQALAEKPIPGAGA